MSEKQFLAGIGLNLLVALASANAQSVGTNAVAPPPRAASLAAAIPERSQLTDAASFKGKRIPLWEATAFIMVGQFALVEAFRDSWRKDDGYKFQDGWSHLPQWENDPWYYNYGWHPIAGSEYYLAPRNRGWSPGASFLYAGAMSTFFEYVPENTVQMPSATDLICTPFAGAVLGEIRYSIKQRIAKRHAGTDDGKLWYVLVDALDVTVGGYPDGHPRLYFISVLEFWPCK